MRALLIDDEQLVLEGLAAYLQVAWPELSLDLAADLPTALRLAAAIPYPLVLLDWHLVGEQGQAIEADGVVQALRGAGVGAAVLLVSGDDPQRCRERVQRLGLAGYVPKRASGAALLAAMRTALAGGQAWPDPDTEAKARLAARPMASPEPPPSPTLAGAEAPVPAIDWRLRFPALTDRQAEVLAFLVQGAGDKQIARGLGVSLSTARSHVRGVLSAVGVNRRGEAAYRAMSGDASG